MSETGRIAFQWWREALGGSREPAQITARQRALRARLRRARGAVEVLAEEDAAHLARALHLTRCADVAAALAQVLAHVKAASPQPLAAAFGARAGEQRALKELRFQRLIRAPDPVALAPLLIRALPLVGQAAHVGRLAGDVVHWSNDVRTRWCFEYFGATPPEVPATADMVPEMPA